MIVKTVEIVEKRRTVQASRPRLNHASLEREAGGEGVAASEAR